MSFELGKGVALARGIAERDAGKDFRMLSEREMAERIRRVDRAASGHIYHREDRTQDDGSGNRQG